MPADQWRLFVAAPLPEHAAAEAWRALAPVRERHPDVRWLTADKLHLTLVFLGSTPEREVPSLGESVAGVARDFRAFQVATGRPGGRTADRRGGVAWLRLAVGREQIADLALATDEALGTRTYDSARPPRPHLTLARGTGQDAVDDLAGLVASGLQLSWTVKRIALFRSHTGPAGSRYEELTGSDLGGRGSV